MNPLAMKLLDNRLYIPERRVRIYKTDGINGQDHIKETYTGSLYLYHRLITAKVVPSTSLYLEISRDRTSFCVNVSEKCRPGFESDPNHGCIGVFSTRTTLNDKQAADLCQKINSKLAFLETKDKVGNVILNLIPDNLGFS